ncbi:uncharacterized protein LOC112499892 [Cynara cardunculus var. scolymus]|uniref:uncharacterized protein LOC112499892 n=1 Tax=Cynara cardunculus var. scolymus TaxID=59895 RepID=UPI000D6259C6|nr:uncharacterized protein LOC112499892 [Cynara cardunculus var. scolymus]
MLNENGIFFFKFNDVGGCDQVIEAGPLMIRGIPLFVHRWDPSKGLRKPEHSSCPLWVKLHNIPLVALNREGVSRIASVLGVHKQMDSCTAAMCKKASGRPGFAKVLVEVWAIGELKRKIEVEIPNLNGGDADSVQIQVEYLWEPVQCSHCNIFGHKISTCTKAASLNKGKHIDVRKDSEGFIRVEKKHWRVKSGGKPDLHGARQVFENDKSGPPASSLVANNSQHEQDKVRIMGASVGDPVVQQGNIMRSASGDVVSMASSSQSSQSSHPMATSTPLLSSVIKNFRLPRKGVMKDPVEASNIFGVLEQSGGEGTQTDSQVSDGKDHVVRTVDEDNRGQGDVPTSSSC